MDGTDSRDGWVPAEATAMSGDAGKKKAPPRDKPSDERVRISAWACLCFCTASRLCLFVFVWVQGKRKDVQKMWLVLKHCSRQGRLSLEIPAYMCQHYGCVVCEGVRANVKQAISGHAVSVSCDSVWTQPPSQPAYCNPPCLAHGSGYSSAHPTLALRGTQYSLHRQGLLIAMSEAILSHPLIGLAEVLFSMSWLCVTANRWHLDYGWRTPAGLELTALLMATLQMAFHSWLINAIKHSLFLWDKGQAESVFRSFIFSSKRVKISP